VKTNARMSWAALCLLMLIWSAGCAALSPVATKQESLEERVKQFMQAQVDGKWDRAYSFFDSSSREQTTRESYVNQSRKMSYRGYGIKEITVLSPGDQATVKVTYDIFLMGYEFKGAPKTQTWVKENGAWFVKREPLSAQQTLFTPLTPQKKPE
jgi:hypothetical protein